LTENTARGILYVDYCIAESFVNITTGSCRSYYNEGEQALVEKKIPGCALKTRRNSAIYVCLALAAYVFGIGSSLFGQDTPHEWPMGRCNPGQTGVSPDQSVKPPLRRKWAYQTPAGFFKAAPIAAAGKLFVTLGEGQLMALDADTGKHCWSRMDLDSNYSRYTPSSDGKRLFFSRTHGRKRVSLVALDVETGKTLWTYDATTAFRGIFGGLWEMSAVPAEGKVFYVRVDKTGAYVVALNPADGKEMWASKIAEPGWSITPPSYADGMLYSRANVLKSTKGHVVGLKASNGTIVWKRNDFPVSTAGSMCSTDGTIVCCPGGTEGPPNVYKAGEAIVLDARTGKTLWTAWTNPREWSWHAAPVITGSYILATKFGVGSSFDIYDRNTGNKLGRAGLPGGASNCAAPCVSGNYAYMGGGTKGTGWRFGKGQRYSVSSVGGIDLKTRKQVWNYRLQGNTCANPIIAYGRLYMICGGWVYCFEPSNRDRTQIRPNMPQVKPWKSGDVKFPQGPGRLATFKGQDRPAGGYAWPMYGGCAARTGLELRIGTSLKPAWRFDTGGEVHSSAAISKGMAYVGSDSGKLFALDLRGGGKRWEFKAGDKVHCSPAVGNGLVVFGSDDGTIYALDASNGKKKWEFQTHDWVRAAPAIHDNTVIAAGWDRCVYALDLQTGRKLWHYATHHEINAAPAVHKGKVFVGSGDWVIYALDLKTGRKDWHFLLGPAQGVAVYRDTVCVTITGGAMGFFRPEDGQPAVKFRIGKAGRTNTFGAPAFSGDIMFTGMCGRDRDGMGMFKLKEGRLGSKWYQARGSKCLNTPLTTKDVMVIATLEGALETHSVSDGQSKGKKLWNWKTPSGKMFHTSPAAAAGYIVVGNDDGYVYGFRY